MNAKMMVQVGKKADPDRVRHTAWMVGDKIQTRCGKGVKNQIFYILKEGESAGYCVKCNNLWEEATA